MNFSGFNIFFLSFLFCFLFLFQRAVVDTFIFWQADFCFLTFSDDEGVSESGGEGLSSWVFNVNDIERSQMSVSGGDLSDSSFIVTLGHEDQISEFEFNVIDDFILNQVQLDGVVDVDFRVRVSDGSSVMGDNVWNFVGSNFLSNNFQKLESGFLRL